MWGPKQEKVRKPWVFSLYCWISSMRVSEEERSVRDGVQTSSSSERQAGPEPFGTKYRYVSDRKSFPLKGWQQAKQPQQAIAGKAQRGFPSSIILSDGG